MAKGNKILIRGDLEAHKEEIIVSGTPKPGTVMQLTAATEPSGGIFTYEAFNRDADGDNNEIAVLLENESQGGLATDAYASGDRARIYYPQHGDELNMLVANVEGTGDSFAIGDLLMVDDGTGKLIATTGTPEREPFKVRETVAAIAADTLVRCLYTGS
jgi:hypothetical protein